MARNLIKCVLILLLFADVAFAGTRFNSVTGSRDYCLTVESEDGSVKNQRCRKVQVSEGALTKSGSGDDTVFLIRAGLATGDATSMTTSDTAVSTSFSLVDKKIADDPAFQAGTLADGTPGQMMTVVITEVNGDGIFELSPTTSTGFTKLIFEAVDDRVTMVYVDDTLGWIVISQGSTQME